MGLKEFAWPNQKQAELRKKGGMRLELRLGLGRYEAEAQRVDNIL